MSECAVYDGVILFLLSWKRQYVFFMSVLFWIISCNVSRVSFSANPGGSLT